jgi:hypothetical protein
MSRAERSIIDKCELFVKYRLSKRQQACIKIIFHFVSGLHVYI